MTRPIELLSVPGDVVLVDQSARSGPAPEPYPRIPAFFAWKQGKSRRTELDGFASSVLSAIADKKRVHDIHNRFPDRPRGDIERVADELLKLNLLDSLRLPGPGPRIIRASSKPGLEGIPYAPEAVTWMVTDACNLSCRHCINRQVLGKPVRREMPLAECADLIDRLDERGVAFLELSGGEPLVRPDIFEILEHCASKSFRFTLFTNGVLIDVPGTVDKLLRIHELSKGSFSIHVSLDGGQPEGHDWLRGGKGLFQRTRNALSLLSDRGIPARVVESVVTRQSMHQFEALVELCLQNGIGHVNLHPALNFEPAGNGLSLSFEDRVRCFEKTMDLKCRVHDAIAFDYDDPGFPIGLCHTPGLRDAKIKTAKLYLEMARANAVGNKSPEQDRLPSRVCETPGGCGETLNCSAGITRMFVTACGDVYPCLLFVGSKRDFCGNAVGKGLLEIWESQGMARARIPLTRDLFRFCSRCAGYNRCGRRAKKCRIGAERALGDFFGPSPLCVDFARQLGLPSEILDIYGGRE